MSGVEVVAAPPQATGDVDYAANPTEGDAVPDIRPTAKALSRLLRPVRGRLVLACVLQALSSVAGIVPFVAVVELARVLLQSGPVDARQAWLVAGVGVAALLVRMVLLGGAVVTAHLADVDLQLHVRRRLAAHLGRVPLGWFGDRTSGQVKKALQDDVAAMHHLVGHSLTDLTAAAVTPVVSLAYLFWVDWRLALVTLVPVVIGFALYAQQYRGYGDAMTQYNGALERINSTVVEFVQGIGVVKTFGQTGRAHARFAAAADDFADMFYAWVRKLLRLSAATEVVMSPLAVLTVVLAGGTVFVANGWADALDVLPFALLGLGLTAPVLALGYSVSDLERAQTAAGRVVNLLETPVLVEPVEPVVPQGHRVVLDGVTFSYDGVSDVLRDVDLVLEPGTTTALVGPSGSGKSTLARLLPRFWDPGTGSVTLGGADLRQFPTAELYRHVSFVFQDVQLLRLRVRDNIALARPDAVDADIEAVARAAQIHDRILDLPRGYDSVVGEDALFSGGEAQRVSIARALLADTPVLVLDEATAFADPESEAAIQDAISTLVTGRTLLIIAHRLSTITGVDQIVVMAEGRVVERGRHADLVGRGGRYARMWGAHERTRGHAMHTTEETR